MAQNQETVQNNVKKLVSNAKAILTNQIALPLGVRKMNKIRYWINQSQSIMNIDFKIFDDFDNMTKGCPVGSERLLWAQDALKVQDKIVDNASAIYKEGILGKCFEIIETLDSKK
jgi:hypothetical protein